MKSDNPTTGGSETSDDSETPAAARCPTPMTPAPEDIERAFARMRSAALATHHDAFLEEFQGESDRAAAVLAGAYLDESLRRILANSVVGDPRLATRLLDGERAPLGAFGARIIACYSFGLISRDEFDDLERVRKIRNDFAHKQHGFSFSVAPASSHASQMKFYLWLKNAFPTLSTDTPRKIFDFSVVALSMALLIREGRTSKITELPTQFFDQLAGPPAAGHILLK
jgi:hypothetical protein